MIERIGLGLIELTNPLRVNSRAIERPKAVNVCTLDTVYRRLKVTLFLKMILGVYRRLKVTLFLKMKIPPH